MIFLTCSWLTIWFELILWINWFSGIQKYKWSTSFRAKLYLDYNMLDFELLLCKRFFHNLLYILSKISDMSWLYLKIHFSFSIFYYLIFLTIVSIVTSQMFLNKSILCITTIYWMICTITIKSCVYGIEDNIRSLPFKNVEIW